MKKVNLLLSLLLLLALLLSGCRSTEAPEESTAGQGSTVDPGLTGEESQAPEEVIRRALKMLSGLKASDIRKEGTTGSKLTNEEIAGVMNTVSPEFLTFAEGEARGYEKERFELFDFWFYELAIEKDGQVWNLYFGCSLPENLTRIYFRPPDRDERYDFFIENEAVFNLVRYKGMTEDDQYDIKEEDYRKVMEDPTYQPVKDILEDMLTLHNDGTYDSPAKYKAWELTVFKKARSYEAEGFFIELYDVDCVGILADPDKVIHETYPDGFVGGMHFDPWYRIANQNLVGPIAVQFKDGKLVSAVMLPSETTTGYLGEATYKDYIDEILMRLEEAKEEK